jgi:hypothetical protein
MMHTEVKEGNFFASLIITNWERRPVEYSENSDTTDVLNARHF